MEMFLTQLFVFLLAAAISVPIAKRLGLGSVLGYLIAGIVIGPFGLSLIADVESVLHFTEFGVVMMLFIIGLELQPSLLMKLKVSILGIGGAQVGITALFIGIIGWFILPWQEAIAVGLTLALSSTAIVVQTLKENGLMQTRSGRNIFSVLLFQDLAVIPILALLPLLATHSIHYDSHAENILFDITSLPGYLQFLSIISALVIVFIVARYLSRPVFRIIAKTNVREIFIAAALVLIVGISLLMTVVGLSPALGTFLAGVILADSEYKHELESDIEPFKGLLLGIFFISIGASMNFNLIGENVLLILGVAIGLVILKAAILYIIGLAFNMKIQDRTLFSISLAQGGEFAFVLFSFALANGVLESQVTEPLIASVAISMFLAPILFKLYEVLVSKKSSNKKSDEHMDDINESGRKVILAGFGQLGTDIGRFLISSGIKPVILDHDADNIDLLNRLGFEVYYGDATRLDLLESAGIGEAELLIVAVSTNEISLKLVELVKKHYPHIKIIAAAEDFRTTYQLMDLNVETVRRDRFGSALTIGQDALKALGVSNYDAYRLTRIFRKHDEDMINALHKLQGQADKYISTYRQQLANLEELMTLDLEFEKEELDNAWTAKNPED